ncbi:HypC/HybG/HupF family hydrogenase formation chaperone [Demequina salsinemoris]|uniref:HypC/HybG/HupF family hydrogenase formation chaperone n=1 Tax=Demequina salsinemoris TaxID=577470 RepID=UPI000783F8B7|nr:HypC/HybG/HupF family hydrogenase formation chaperone [Demequina salsinemoris]
MTAGKIAKVVEVHRDGRAIVEIGSERQEVLEMTVSDDDITPGDWVIVRSGFALERLTDKELKELQAQHKTEITA